MACTRVPSQNKDMAKVELQLQLVLRALLMSNCLSNMPFHFCTFPLP